MIFFFSEFVQYNNIPIGATRYQDKLFITIPRRRPGIPVTLTYIYLNASIDNPSLRPYPNLATNRVDTNHQLNRNRLISVYRTSVDACQRLWFTDTGMLEYPGNIQIYNKPY